MKVRGFNFTIVTSQSALNLPHRTTYEGIPVYRFSFHESLVNRDMKAFLAVRKQLAELKRSFKPDLIHMNNIGSDAFYHLHTASSNSIPVLVTLHGLPLVPISGNNSLVSSVLRSAHWVTTVSKAMLGEVHERFPETASRSSFIHNGLHMPDLQPKPLPLNPPRLLCLGRLVEHKGFDVAVDAFSMLRERFPELRLIVAGDGPARPALEHRVNQMGLGGDVEFLGLVDAEEVPELLNRATVVIMPSRREPFGLVALEAAQMARPIVASKVGGLPEVVVHNRTGLLVEKDNSAAIVEGVEYLLNNTETAARLGRCARERAHHLFNMKRHADAYDTLYRWLCSDVT
jgi:glycogen(starch) synthase